MKTKSLLVLASTSLMVFNALAWAPPGEGWQVSDKGPDHRKWTRVAWTTNQAGVRVLNTNTVVQLETGLHRDVDGQWVATEPRIQPATNGALCLGGRHQVWLSENLNTRAAVMIRTPEGNWLKANVLGLAYQDSATGQSVTIARLKDCVGEIVGTNQVLYRDAFTGVKADVRFEYRKSAVEQDVILRQCPALPEAYNLNPATTHLLVLTEFLDTPAPTWIAQDTALTRPQTNLLAAMTARLAGMTNRAGNAALLAKWRGMVARAHEREDGLSFGGMRVGAGRAFELPQETNSAPSLTNALAARNAEAKLKAVVRKEWRRIDGRDFLIERVNVKEIRSQLQKLPLTAQADTRPGPGDLRQQVRDTLQMPGPLLAAAVPNRPMLLARNDSAEPGFVLDWNMVPTPYTDYTFAGSYDSTYIVSGDCYLDGTTTISDGAVIKFLYDPNAGWPALHLAGPVLCPASSTAYFTSTEDDSVGAMTSQSYGINGVMYGTALDIDGWSSGPCLLQNLEFRHAWVGVALNGNWGSSVEHLVNNCNFVECHGAFNLNGTRVRMNGGGISLNYNYGSNEAISGNDYHLTAVGTVFSGYPLVVTDNRDPNSTPSLVISQNSSVYGELAPSGPVVLLVDPPVVSVTATDSQAVKGTSDTGTFTVTRTGDTSGDLYVHSLPAGTAVENVDYTGIPSGFTIPASQSEATFTVTPEPPNANGAASATANLKLLEWPFAYLLEPPGEDTVFITDSTAPAYPAPLGVVGWWRGQDNAQDSVGTNPGTLSWADGNTSGGYDGGLVGNAFHFFNASAGSSHLRGAHIYVSDAPALKPVAVTVETWVKFTEADTLNNPWPGRQVIVAKPGLNGAAAYVLRKEGDRFNFAVGAADGTQVAATSTTSIQLNRWYHVAGSYDPAAGQVRLYVNGALQDTQPATFAVGYGTGGLFIGMSADANSSAFANLCGLVDEVTLYERALTATEVASIHSIASRGKTYDPLDKDADRLPDAWELVHFGNLDQTAGGDYDGDTVINRDEYLANTNPNDIQFAVNIGYGHVSTLNPTGTVDVLSGVPYEIAWFVDTDDFSNPSWHPFTAAPVIPLTGADGEHQVWFSLRARVPYSDVVWMGCTVVVDRTTPTLTVSSPAAGVTGKPFVQVSGTANEPLSMVRCLVNNALGWTTNIGFVTGQNEQTVSFNCFDVELTNGLNLLRVEIADRAGNTSHSDAELTFDISSDSVAPVVTLQWPHDGQKIGVDTFTLRGAVDDETATVQLTAQGASQETREYSGNVERNGALWVDDVALEPGVNSIILRATDAKGNYTETTMTVERSTVNLTITEPNEEQLLQPKVNLSGTISDNIYEVWVNGVLAGIDGNIWTAENVPVPAGGSAVFAAAAVPGGGGVPNPTAANPDQRNPNGPNNVTSAIAPEKKASVELAHGEWEAYDFAGSTLGGYYEWTYLWNWDENTGGYAERSHTEPLPGGESSTGLRYWVDLNGVERFEHWQDTPDNITSTAPVEIAPYFWQGWSVKGPKAVGKWADIRFSDCGSYMTSDTARDVRLMLRTGGRDGVRRKNLFSATASTQKRTSAGWRDIPSQQIKVPNFGTVGADGRVYAVLPDNTNFVITPFAPASYYTFDVQPTKHKPVIWADNGVKAVPLYSDKLANAKFAVGQKIKFSFQFMPEVQGILDKDVSWGLSSTFINAFDCRTDAGNLISEEDYDVAYSITRFRVDQDRLHTEETHAWWLTGSTYGYKIDFASLGLHFRFRNGQELGLNLKRLFGMHRPTIVWNSTAYNQPQVYARVHPGSGVPQVGISEWWAPTPNGYMNQGANSVSLEEGQLGVTQLMKRDANLETWIDWRLDNAFPYDASSYAQGFGQWEGGCQLLDTPNAYGLTVNAYCTDEFKDYWMFRPATPGSIWVTLGITEWGWSGDMIVTWFNPVEWHWRSEPWVYHSQSIAPSSELPEWTTRKWNIGGGQ